MTPLVGILRSTKDEPLCYKRYSINAHLSLHINKCGGVAFPVENSTVIQPDTPTPCHSTYEYSNDFVVETKTFYLTRYPRKIATLRTP